ncbi:hypothetical protein LAUMK35_05257 [Mycobacterium pseudokansasii]|nr:hypothetical protein LAUMK35_05257 [Mycobacterium pseudokansasii]VBA34182.1 hypothetical protein LAUMK21_05215 [Mycobacterium pseudokansasii]
MVGVAVAIGLVLFFVCAIYTHILARDYSPQFALAIGFLALNVASPALALNAARIVTAPAGGFGVGGGLYCLDPETRYVDRPGNRRRPHDPGQHAGRR